VDVGTFVWACVYSCLFVLKTFTTLQEKIRDVKYRQRQFLGFAPLMYFAAVVKAY
jgi:hypothetical protein